MVVAVRCGVATREACGDSRRAYWLHKKWFGMKLRRIVFGKTTRDFHDEGQL